MVIYSYSRLQTFEQCQLKFKFKYIDELEPEIKQTIEGFLGNKVHETLEWIYKSIENGPSPTLDETIEYYLNSWNKNFNSEIKIVKKDLTAEYYFNRGIRLIVDYYTENFPFKDNTIATEKLISFNLDEKGEYKFRGYVDRIVYNEETNTYEIHDYKTTESPKSQEDLDKDKQLAAYSIALREQFNTNNVDLIWHFLSFNKKMTSRRTTEQLQDLKNQIIELIKKIESTTKFEPNPGKICDWCEFRKYCPVWN